MARRSTDVDGRDLIDFCMAFGPLILGHGNAEVRAEAIARDRPRLEPRHRGAVLARARRADHRARAVGENVRFVNSGTEAVMSALRVARGATARDKILKFDGCYHGHADAMLIRAGSGLAEVATPDSAGLDHATLGDTIVAPLDDEAALEAVFERMGSQIAAVIIEPLPANYGLLPQRHEFLAASRRAVPPPRLAPDLRRGHHRLPPRVPGVRGLHGFEPDLVTYGKVIGGGFPVGAYGGKREYMELVAPVGPVYQAGTLSANPVAMCAGLATLNQLADGAVYARLEALGQRLERGLGTIAGVHVQRAGSLFWFHLSPQGEVIRNLGELRARAGKPFGPLFHRVLDDGIYLAPSAFEVGFLSAAHGEAHVDALVASIGKALAEAA